MQLKACSEYPVVTLLKYYCKEFQKPLCLSSKMIHFHLLLKEKMKMPNIIIKISVDNMEQTDDWQNG